jgi:hypothetical protein
VNNWPLKMYLAGPMSGRPNLNFDAFHEAEEYLRGLGRGFDVYNPAKDDDANPNQPLNYYLRRDFPELMKCDGIVMLPGWRDSKGAMRELRVARWMGMNAYELVNGELDLMGIEYPESVLEEADRLINGDRQEGYGKPLDDFGATGRIFAAILTGFLGTEVPDIPAEYVALMMVGVKLSRESRHHKRDNVVDGAGYLGCLDLVIQERARRSAPSTG